MCGNPLMQSVMYVCYSIQHESCSKGGITLGKAVRKTLAVAQRRVSIRPLLSYKPQLAGVEWVADIW